MRHTHENTILSRLLATISLAAVSTAPARQTEKIARIGVLDANSQAVAAGRLDAFRQGLRELGHVEGQNIAIEFRYADGKLDRIPGLAAELVKLKPDVFVVSSTPGALAAKKATSTIPIVFFGVTDPVGAGLVSSLARPAANITGLTNVAAVLSGKEARVAKGNYPKSLPRRGIVGSEGAWLSAPMERKPTTGERIRNPAPFHGSQQRRQI